MRSGSGGADVVRGLRLIRWIELRPPGKQVAAEGNDAKRGNNRGPGREEEPSGIGKKRIAYGHGG